MTGYEKLKKIHKTTVQAVLWIIISATNIWDRTESITLPTVIRYKKRPDQQFECSQLVHQELKDQILFQIP